MTPSEQSEIRELHRVLSLGAPALAGPAGERLEIPETVYHLLQDLIVNLMRGRTVRLAPQNDTMTTQDAADFLGCSRPHLVKLLEAGSIPFQRVGRHRRVLFKDLMTFQSKRDVERNAALNDLARAVYRDGSYRGLPIPGDGNDE